LLADSSLESYVIINQVNKLSLLHEVSLQSIYCGFLNLIVLPDEGNYWALVNTTFFKLSAMQGEE
jgi:hypothetical protein